MSNIHTNYRSSFYVVTYVFSARLCRLITRVQLEHVEVILAVYCLYREAYVSSTFGRSFYVNTTYWRCTVYIERHTFALLLEGVSM